MQATLGTLLRHLIELLDGAVEAAYVDAGLDYRPRYTPVMRALIASEPLTIGAIALAAGITQPAATQTVALMIKDGLVRAESSATDGRQRLISLTADGKKMVVALTQFWQATAMAASSLEDDMKHPLAEVLASAIEALGHKSFGTRIREARMGMQLDVTSTAAKKRKA